MQMLRNSLVLMTLLSFFSGHGQTNYTTANRISVKLCKVEHYVDRSHGDDYATCITYSIVKGTMNGNTGASNGQHDTLYLTIDSNKNDDITRVQVQHGYCHCSECKGVCYQRDDLFDGSTSANLVVRAQITKNNGVITVSDGDKVKYKKMGDNYVLMEIYYSPSDIEYIVTQGQETSAGTSQNNGNTSSGKTKQKTEVLTLTGGASNPRSMNYISFNDANNKVVYAEIIDTCFNGGKDCLWQNGDIGQKSINPNFVNKKFTVTYSVTQVADPNTGDMVQGMHIVKMEMKSSFGSKAKGFLDNLNH